MAHAPWPSPQVEEMHDNFAEPEAEVEDVEKTPCARDASAWTKSGTQKSRVVTRKCQ